MKALVQRVRRGRVSVDGETLAEIGPGMVILLGVGDRDSEDEARWLGEKGKELLTSYEKEQPTHALRTFEAVEVLWEDVVRPALGEFRTMQDSWREGASLPEESVWYPNWRVPDRG